MPILYGNSSSAPKPREHDTRHLKLSTLRALRRLVNGVGQGCGRASLAGCLAVLILLTGGCGALRPNGTEENTQNVIKPATNDGGSCGLDLAADATTEESVRALLVAEGELLVAQDIDRLMLLWTEASRIVDAKNTPASDDDDQVWEGVDAIRHRYVRTVFPGAPSSASPADLDITITGESAEVLATTNIGTEVSPQGDRWTLIQSNGCWFLESLIYNLEPAP